MSSDTSITLIVYPLSCCSTLCCSQSRPEYLCFVREPIYVTVLPLETPPSSGPGPGPPAPALRCPEIKTKCHLPLHRLLCYVQVKVLELQLELLEGGTAASPPGHLQPPPPPRRRSGPSLAPPADPEAEALRARLRALTEQDVGGGGTETTQPEANIHIELLRLTPGGPGAGPVPTVEVLDPRLTIAAVFCADRGNLGQVTLRSLPVDPWAQPPAAVEMAALPPPPPLRMELRYRFTSDH